MPNIMFDDTRLICSDIVKTLYSNFQTNIYLFLHDILVSIARCDDGGSVCWDGHKNRVVLTEGDYPRF